MAQGPTAKDSGLALTFYDVLLVPAASSSPSHDGENL